jgi:hypothetical protein
VADHDAEPSGASIRSDNLERHQLGTPERTGEPQGQHGAYLVLRSGAAPMVRRMPVIVARTLVGVVAGTIATPELQREVVPASQALSARNSEQRVGRALQLAREPTKFARLQPPASPRAVQHAAGALDRHDDGRLICTACLRPAGSTRQGPIWRARSSIMV